MMRNVYLYGLSLILGIAPILNCRHKKSLEGANKKHTTADDQYHASLVESLLQLRHEMKWNGLDWMS